MGVPLWPLGPNCGRDCILATGALAFLPALVVAERLFSRGARRGSPTWELLRALEAASDERGPQAVEGGGRRGLAEGVLRQRGRDRERDLQAPEEAQEAEGSGRDLQGEVLPLRDQGVPLDDWIPKKAREVEREFQETEKRIKELRAELAEGFKALLSSQKRVR